MRASLDESTTYFSELKVVDDDLYKFISNLLIEWTFDASANEFECQVS